MLLYSKTGKSRTAIPFGNRSAGTVAAILDSRFLHQEVAHLLSTADPVAHSSDHFRRCSLADGYVERVTVRSVPLSFGVPAEPAHV